MEYLLNILEIYSKEPLTLHNSMGDTVVDVLIKIIRVLANMSVNSEVGFGLGSTQSLGTTLLLLLKASQQIKSIKMVNISYKACNGSNIFIICIFSLLETRITRTYTCNFGSFTQSLLLSGQAIVRASPSYRV